MEEVSMIQLKLTRPSDEFISWLGRFTLDGVIVAVLAVAGYFSYSCFARPEQPSPGYVRTPLGKVINCPTCKGTGDNPDPAKYPGQTCCPFCCDGRVEVNNHSIKQKTKESK
jgi:hypothetical protein